MTERLRKLRTRLAKAIRKRKHHSLKARLNKRKAKRIRKKIAALKSGPNAALRWALDQVGTHEDPAGSNRGPGITSWQNHFGSWLIGQPWCGVFVGTAVERAGGDVTARVAAVAFIEDDAKRGINGFRAWITTHADARPGDAVVLFGRGVHVGMVVSVDRARGIVHTVEGNTSPGTSGSQANGGGVYKRERRFSDVHGYARPRY